MREALVLSVACTRPADHAKSARYRLCQTARPLIQLVRESNIVENPAILLPEKYASITSPVFFVMVAAFSGKLQVPCRNPQFLRHCQLIAGAAGCPGLPVPPRAVSFPLIRYADGSDLGCLHIAAREQCFCCVRLTFRRSWFAACSTQPGWDVAAINRARLNREPPAFLVSTRPHAR